MPAMYSALQDGSFASQRTICEATSSSCTSVTRSGRKSEDQVATWRTAPACPTCCPTFPCRRGAPAAEAARLSPH
eukprot:6021339-Heterocapsa_arctica.AAC.1